MGIICLYLRKLTINKPKNACFIVLTAYQHDKLVANLIGNIYLAQDKAAVPACNLVLTHTVKHLAKLLGLIVCIVIGRTAAKRVQLFIVEILNLLRRRLHHADLLALRVVAVARGAIARSDNNIIIATTTREERNNHS